MVHDRSSNGRLFHTEGAEKWKDLCQNVLSFLNGLTSKNLSEDLSVRGGLKIELRSSSMAFFT